MNRMHHIDIAKGALILCLLISHFGIALARNNTGTQFFAPILYWVPLFSIFFMQCFFIMSGYCSNFNLDGKTYFKKIIKQLIVPYIFLGFLNGIASHFLIPNDFNGFFTCFWFLNALIISKTFVWGLKRIIHNDKHVVYISLLILILGVYLNEFQVTEDVLDINKGLIATFFIAFGQMLRNNVSYAVKLRKVWFIYPFIMVIFYAFNYQWSLPSQDANIRMSIVQIPLFLFLTNFKDCIFI
jgi:fucose 4-O-acetylase-like acetyltransferase